MCVCAPWFSVFLQDSESLYSDHLHLFADLLQSLFKETYTLQKQLMELLDRISVDSCAAEGSTTIMVSGGCTKYASDKPFFTDGHQDAKTKQACFPFMHADISQQLRGSYNYSMISG